MLIRYAEAFTGECSIENCSTGKPVPVDYQEEVPGKIPRLIIYASIKECNRALNAAKKPQGSG